jgi:hypothetical protein
MTKFRIEILHKFNKYGEESKTFYPQVLDGEKYKYLTQKTVYLVPSGLEAAIEYILTDEIIIDGFTKTECNNFHMAETRIRHYQSEHLPLKEQKRTYEYLDL